MDQTGLVASTRYDYKVFSFNNSGCAGPTYLSATPLLGSFTTCAATTGTPTGLTTTAVHATDMDVSWTAPATGTIDFYELDVSTSSTFATYVQQAINTGSGTSYSVSGLTQGTLYYLRVRAVIGTCYSASTLSINRTTAFVPAITAISANSCAFPVTLTITGTNLTAATAVDVAGTTVTIVSNSATIITATVNAAVNGTVNVTTAGGTASSATNYIVSSLPGVTVNTSVPSFCGTGTFNTNLTLTTTHTNYTYTWTALTAGSSVSAATGATSTATLTATSDFQLTAHDATVGCDATAVASIGVYPFPSSTMATTITTGGAATANNRVCLGTGVTVSSGLSAGNFSSAATTHAARTAPASATVLVTAGAAVVAQKSGTLDDGGWNSLPIGFHFNFFGTIYDSVNIGTNGIVQFGAYNSTQLADFTFVTLPSTTEPFNIVAVCADDNDFRTGGSNAANGTIRYWTTGYAPNRVFVVEYSNARTYNSGIGATNYLATTTTSQAHFFETTGNVEVHVLSSSDNVNTKVVGINNGDGTIGVKALGTAAAITSPVAYRFAPPSNYTTTWTINGVAGSAETNAFTKTLTPSVAGTTPYSLVYQNTVTGCNNSTAPATISVVALAAPTAPTVATVAPICAGTATTLNVTSALVAPDSARWYSVLTAGTALTTTGNGAAYTTPTLSAATTSYYVETWNGVCANTGARTQADVTTTSAPSSVLAAAATTICTGSSTNLTATITGGTGPFTLLYTDGATTSTASNYASADPIAVSPTATTTYTVTGITDANMCHEVTMTGTPTVTVSATTVAGTVGTSTAVCGTTNSGTLTLTGNTGSVTKWQSSLDNFATAGTDITNTTTTLNYTNLPAGATSYKAVVKSGACAAADATAATVTVSAAPTTAAAGSPQSSATGAFTLAGNTPSVGTGAWSVLAAGAAVVTTTSSPTSAATVGVAGDATLRWTISSTGCPASTSDVVLTNSASIGDVTDPTSCSLLTSVTIDTTNNSVWVPMYIGSNIVAAIKANGQNLGLVTGAYFAKSGSVRLGGQAGNEPYLNRNISLSVANQPATNVDVKMYITTAEWTALTDANPAILTGGFELTRINTVSTCSNAYSSSAGQRIMGATLTDVNSFKSINFATNHFSEFFVNGPNAALPLEIVSLKATGKGANNLIEFTTANEVNVKGFNIERSATGTEGWSVIGNLKAKGASTYTFVDNQPTPTSYYRLRAIDTDGKETLSKIVSVTNGKGKLAILSLYPNPTKAITTVDFEVPTTGSAIATVKDITGRVVFSKNVSTTEGVNQLAIDMSELANGLYILNISDKTSTVVKRIVKQ